MLHGTKNKNHSSTRAVHITIVVDFFYSGQLDFIHIVRKSSSILECKFLTFASLDLSKSRAFTIRTLQLDFLLTRPNATAQDFELCDIIEEGYIEAPKKKKKQMSENDTKAKLNSIAMHILLCGLNEEVSKKVSTWKRAKEMWEKLEGLYGK
ncbi:hypothetical protein GQ457_07G006530 [Hibiscus cannabinus]